eukprot:TRINITY_DN66114_c0_g1_i1.p1 TRINITY_DN66114_c0_g1~~TRINITY_DN66114_c0_g1_i1.p1  ORF type:complete len:354 (-),score=59.67 TRINITY_DN66114_c0_g1_i1:54-1061(-)
MVPKAPPGGPGARGSRPGPRPRRPASPPPFATEADVPEDTPYPELDGADLTLEKKLGCGCTAEVFKGTYKGKIVAIKQIYRGSDARDKRDGGKKPVRLEIAFAREVTVLSKIQHENLVKFYGVCFADAHLRVVTDFCGGGTLFEFLHEGEDEQELLWSQKFKMCHDVASGMHYLHTFKPPIIHRDLKSLNLLLAEEVHGNELPHVKISDFGLSRMKDLEAEWEQLTKSAGTCHWMAPEVCTGKYDLKADVYSYAMVLFEIICLEIPFEEEEGADVIKIILGGGRPTLEAVPPDCPQELERLMIACWQQGPADRPSSADILKILSECEPVIKKMPS